MKVAPVPKFLPNPVKSRKCGGWGGGAHVFFPPVLIRLGCHFKCKDNVGTVLHTSRCPSVRYSIARIFLISFTIKSLRVGDFGVKIK